MTERVRIAVLDDYQDAARSRADWSGLLPEADVEFIHEHIHAEDELVSMLAPFDIVVAMRERTRFPRAVLEALPGLRLLVTTGMRNASIDVEAAHERGIVVSGTRGYPSSTAELAWALILGLMRNIPTEDARIRAGGWQATVGRDLAGSTLGIVGLGRQGAQVAAVGAAFGMDVIAWSPHLTDERAAAGGARRVSKHELFAGADVVSVHLVLSDETRGIVGEPELRAMDARSFLVNTARALLIDQDALRLALTEGWIAGAGLDVFDLEPLPADHWLRASARTLLTPHLGYVTEGNYELFYGGAVDDIRAFLDGTPVNLL